MKKGKKIISLLLSLIIALSAFTVFPLTAAAESSSPTSSVSAGDDEIAVTGSNSLGDMMAEEYEKSKAGDGADKDNLLSSIYDIEIEGNTARAEIRPMDDAQLIVSIFDDDGKVMYGSGMTDITLEDRIVELTLEIDTMPQYFLVRAYMIDKYTHLPLCKQYENDHYTRQMQEFFEKTTDDFDQDRVLNLDEDKDNNFVVYNEDTVVIENTDTNTNVIAKADRDNLEYVIENIDDTVASLQPGDIFSYKYSEDDLLIVRVASINISGTTATIRGGDLELKDVFDYIRIDVAQDNTEAAVDNSHLDEGIEYIGEDDSSLAPTGADDSASVVPFSLNYKLKEQRFGDDKDEDGEPDNSISGTVALKFEVEVSFHYDANLFTDDDVKLELALKYNLSYTVAVELSLIEWEFELGDIFWTPVPGVTISFTPSLVVEGSVKIEVVGKISGQIGKKFENGVFSDNSVPPHFDATYKAEGELFIGISLKPEVSLLWEVASASLSAKAGVKATAKIEYKDDGQQHDEKHMCTACIDGELDFVFSISLKLTVLDIKKLTYKADLLEITCKLCDFYYSIDNKEFAFTECPNKAFKTTITLLSTRGVPIFDSKINGEPTKSGKAVLYFAAGKHEITIEKDGKEITTSLNITGASSNTLKVDFDKSEISTQTSDAGEVDIVKPLVFTAKGTYGDNISWAMTDDGVLYISGSGDMPPREELIPEEGHIQIYNRPWSRNIKSVVIDDGITSIGEEAFIDCEDLKSVEIPYSVKSIGKSAFKNCYDLKSINIPKSVTYIGEYAFGYCYSLDNVVIPDSVKTIGGGAFYECTSLKNVVIPDFIPYIGSSVFYDTSWYDNQPDGVVYAGKVAYDYKGVCPDEVKIKDGTLGINNHAFSGRHGLKSIEIPDSVISIGESAFYSCENLESINIPDSVTSIGEWTFYGCENLESINIPESVTFIGESAFADCSSLTSITIPDSVTSLGKIDHDSWYWWYTYGIFENCSSLTDVKIGNSIPIIEESMFKGCTSLQSIVIPDSVKEIGEYAFSECTNLQSVVINGATSIGDLAFNNCTSLQSVVINGATSIGDLAFSDCTSLQSIIIPDSVKEIGRDAFVGCTNLANIDFSDSTEIIGESAFLGTAWDIEQPDGEVYAGKVLYSYKTDFTYYLDYPDKVKIKDGTLGIAGGAFYGKGYSLDMGFKSIEIPDSVTNIGDSAFEHCRNLMSVTLPDSLISIGDRAFMDCTSLTSILIPDSVTDIGEYALGYYEDEDDDRKVKPIENFIIYGHSGTAAEEYANSNHIYFGILSDKAGTAAAPAAADTSQTSVEAPAAELTGDTDLAYVGASDTDVSEFVCARKHLVPGTEALLVILRNNDGGAVITPGNLLYIAQQTVSESGKVEISCFGDFGDNAVSFIIGQCDHSSATWHTAQEATAQEGGFAVLECNYCNKIIDTKEANSLSDTLLGDTDGDGEVTILDATAIQRQLASIPTFAYIEAAADTDGDGEITIIDATYSQRWLVNLKSNDNIGKPLNK